MAKYGIVASDLDGTLLDSMFIWNNIGEEYLKSLNIEPKENLAGIKSRSTVGEKRC